MNKQMKTLSATAAVLLACGLSIPANADTAYDEIGNSYPVGAQAAPRQATEAIGYVGPTLAAGKQAIHTAYDEIGNSYPVSSQAAPRQAKEAIWLAGPTSAAVKQANDPEIERDGGTDLHDGGRDLFWWQAIQRDSQSFDQ